MLSPAQAYFHAHRAVFFMSRKSYVVVFPPPFFVLRRAVVVGLAARTMNQMDVSTVKVARKTRLCFAASVAGTMAGLSRKKKRLYIFMYNTHCIYLAVAITAVQALFDCESEISSYRAPTPCIKLLWGKPKTTRITRNSSDTDDKNLTSLICLH